MITWLNHLRASELVARLKVRLRRTPGDGANSLRIADISIDQVARSSLSQWPIDRRSLRLEFDLLVALAKEPGRVSGSRPALERGLGDISTQPILDL
jgi:DNA-binding response OmpR family regulator